MNCPHCASTSAKEQTQKTTLGYRTFRCSACKHLFNERTGTPLNFLEDADVAFHPLMEHQHTRLHAGQCDNNSHPLYETVMLPIFALVVLVS